MACDHTLLRHHHHHHGGGAVCQTTLCSCRCWINSSLASRQQQEKGQSADGLANMPAHMRPKPAAKMSSMPRLQ